MGDRKVDRSGGSWAVGRAVTAELPAVRATDCVGMGAALGHRDGKRKRGCYREGARLRQARSRCER